MFSGIAHIAVNDKLSLLVWLITSAPVDTLHFRHQWAQLSALNNVRDVRVQVRCHHGDLISSGYPGVDLQDHRLMLYLTFWGATCWLPQGHTALHSDHRWHTFLHVLGTPFGGSHFNSCTFQFVFLMLRPSSFVDTHQPLVYLPTRTVSAGHLCSKKFSS